MIDNYRILRMRNEISATRNTLEGIRQDPGLMEDILSERLDKMEADEREEQRRLVGQVHFVLDLIEQNPRLLERLRSLLISSPPPVDPPVSVSGDTIPSGSQSSHS
jgi:hypothetical protein